MMWVTIFTVLSITTFTIVTCNLINLDNIWTSTSTFHRDHDYALIGHVIKTLPLFIADCLVACQEAFRCFSVNYVNFHNGTFICELNWSSKKQSKDSFVRREGFEYAEPPDFKYCDKTTCASKGVSEGGWYKFNTHQFKMFYEKKSWSDAKTHCKSIGGDLASFGSVKEYQYVREVLLYPDFLMNRQLDEYTLINNAGIVTKDNRRSLYFDGRDDQATVPSVNFHTSDFTIAFWFKNPQTSYGFFNFFNDERQNSNRMFTIYVYYSSMACSFFNIFGEQFGINYKTSNMPLNQWNHVAVTWSRQTKRLNLFIDSIFKTSKVSALDNVDLRNTGFNTFQVGHRNGGQLYKGWLSDIVILPYALAQAEIESLKDGKLFGAWIGLNDINKEGTLTWSDNTPLTYTASVQNQDIERDCAYLRKDSNAVTSWSLEKCIDSHPFICKKM